MDTKETPEKKKIKPDLPGGFRDYGFSEMAAKQNLIDTFRQTAESFGFDPLETSSVQKTEVLTGGEETASKIIFNVKGARDESEELSDTSLRFDLTVPLARFLAANPEIPKPFRRYEIGKVWRGERQQAGRYREFTQADVDIVGSPLLEADAEIISFMYQFLKKLGLDKFTIKINFRDEATAMLEKYGVAREQQIPTLIEVDKKEKLAPEEWEKRINLISGLKEKRVKDYIKEITGEPSSDSKYNNLKKLLVGLGVDERNIKYDGAIVRGLAYYTGTVFETILNDYPEIGSFFSGGRYDNLIESFTGQKIPAVGVSLGVDRLMTAWNKLAPPAGGLLKEKNTARVLVLRLLEDIQNYTEIVNDLRGAGIGTEFYLGKEDTMQAQFAYALKKEFPFVLIYGEEEKKKGMVSIKNLQTREQKEIPKSKILDYFKK
ncbi:MAG: histidine--tRNA ligase [bacterium]|nr:histidine--tRNA ligase [bacterium]